MSYGQLKSESKNKFLKVKEGKPVNIHILTESEGVLHQFVHMLPENKREICARKQCVYCNDGNQPKERWSIVIYDWDDQVAKVFEFGFGIFNQIKGIAMMMEESNQTIHHTDLRIIASGSGLATKYQVLPRPMKEAVPEGLVLPKLQQKDESIPF